MERCDDAEMINCTATACNRTSKMDVKITCLYENERNLMTTTRKRYQDECCTNPLFNQPFNESDNCSKSKGCIYDIFVENDYKVLCKSLYSLPGNF